jgi:hypothetical protein
MGSRINRLVQAWQQSPDWVKGAVVGALTGVVPVALLLLSIEGWIDPGLWNLLIVGASAFWLPLGLFAVDIGRLDDSVVFYILPPVVRAAAGALLTRWFGLRRGCKALLVIEALLTVLSALSIIGMGALRF